MRSLASSSLTSIVRRSMQGRVVANGCRSLSLLTSANNTTNTASNYKIHGTIAANRNASTPFIQKRTMFIQTSETPNPESIKFMPGRPVLTTELTGDSADATNNGYYATRTDKQDIARSPLAKLLFAIDGVKAVYLGPEKKKQKKRNANPTHVHVPGVDPSQDDIARARELQQIKPPKCFCGQLSRLKKVKKSIAGGEESRAVGNYFFFCNKAKGDESKCRFARPVQDVTKPTKDRLCTFFAKTGSCKKGDKCMFSHDVPGGKGKANDASPSEPEDQAEAEVTAESGGIEKEALKEDKTDQTGSGNSSSDASSPSEAEEEETLTVVTKETSVVEKETSKKNVSIATNSSSDSSSSSESSSDDSESD